MKLLVMQFPPKSFISRIRILPINFPRSDDILYDTAVTYKKRSKAIFVTGRGGLQGQMLRIPYCLNNRLTDGGKVVSLMCQLLLYSPETVFFCFWYSLLLGAE
jgi:hypothetical protein